jgi:hypothetical protein
MTRAAFLLILSTSICSAQGSNGCYSGLAVPSEAICSCTGVTVGTMGCTNNRGDTHEYCAALSQMSNCGKDAQGNQCSTFRATTCDPNQGDPLIVKKASLESLMVQKIIFPADFQFSAGAATACPSPMAFEAWLQTRLSWTVQARTIDLRIPDQKR